MFRKISESITAKVFLLVFAALTACCIGLYLIVAAVFPESYGAVTAAGTQKAVDALMAQAEGATPDELYRVAGEWAARNAAVVSVTIDGSTRAFGAEPPAGAESAYTIATSVELADGRQAYLGITDASGTLEAIGGAFGRLFAPALALITAVSLVVSWACSRLVARPVVVLSDISGRLARLDMTWRADERRADELGTLARSLNSMADRLMETIGGLERANAELARDAAEARSRELRRRDFFAAASHELKTPLAVARAQAEGMMLGIGDFSDHGAHLPQVVAAVDRMDALVREMLEAARVDETAGAAEELDLADEVARARTRVLPLAEGRTVDLRVADTGPFPVRAHRHQIELALDNVLANAALHAPAGSRAEVRLSGGVLAVENPCGPISSEDAARLFEAFFRPDPSRSADSGGTGLGLYLVKSALDALGVSCEVDAADGTFSFTADFRPCAAASPVPASASASAATSASASAAASALVSNAAPVPTAASAPASASASASAFASAPAPASASAPAAALVPMPATAATATDPAPSAPASLAAASAPKAIRPSSQTEL